MLLATNVFIFPFTQVDFANSLIGGGAISHGCVQEEILFMISPELILARLFSERMGDKECIIITGKTNKKKYL